jgi:hypothetical protein
MALTARGYEANKWDCAENHTKTHTMIDSIKRTVDSWAGVEVEATEGSDGSGVAGRRGGGKGAQGDTHKETRRRSHIGEEQE